VRPQTHLRARFAVAGLVALAGTTTVAASPAAGQTQYRGSAPANLTSTPQGGSEAPAARTASTLSIGTVRTNVLLGRSATVRGSISPRRAGRSVRLQRKGARGWSTVARARTAAGGRFTVGLTPRATGSAAIRVLVAGDPHAGPAREGAGRLNVFRRAFASWYGPGLYGNKLGCGGRLTPGTIGVAHKTLPCGARITLRHGSRILRVRVVDRGPYVGGREFDLTAATKQALGFGSTGYVQTTR